MVSFRSGYTIIKLGKPLVGLYQDRLVLKIHKFKCLASIHSRHNLLHSRREGWEIRLDFRRSLVSDLQRISWSSARKTALEKIKKARREEANFLKLFQKPVGRNAKSSSIDHIFMQSFYSSRGNFT